MSKGIFVASYSGIRAMLHDAKIQEECMQQARKVATAAGEGFSVSTRGYPDRLGAIVRAETASAHYRNLRENTLLKAVGK